jgi:hypothetical protein
MLDADAAVIATETVELITSPTELASPVDDVREGLAGSLAR